MGYLAPGDFAAWRRRHGLGDGPITSPSQVDAPADTGWLQTLVSDLFAPSSGAATPGPESGAAGSSGVPAWLLVAAAGGLGYYLLTRQRKKRA